MFKRPPYLLFSLLFAVMSRSPAGGGAGFPHQTPFESVHFLAQTVEVSLSLFCSSESLSDSYCLFSLFLCSGGETVSSSAHLTKMSVLVIQRKRVCVFVFCDGGLQWSFMCLITTDQQRPQCSGKEQGAPAALMFSVSTTTKNSYFIFPSYILLYLKESKVQFLFLYEIPEISCRKRTAVRGCFGLENSTFQQEQEGWSYWDHSFLLFLVFSTFLYSCCHCQKM